MSNPDRRSTCSQDQDSFTALTYDALDRLVSRTEAAGNVWTYEYDVLGGYLPAHFKRVDLKIAARLRVVMVISIVVQIGF
ncbi:hypothetical protein EYD00_05205 [Agrobacterium sp. 33MFTa1.1]|nr:hypothetical protein EYD00_05205 [Agrobacterium sp. 33MFTa1.1]